MISAGRFLGVHGDHSKKRKHMSVVEHRHERGFFQQLIPTKGGPWLDRLHSSLVRRESAFGLVNLVKVNRPKSSLSQILEVG